MRVTVFLTLFLAFCSLDVSAKSYRVTTSAYADHSIRFTNSAYADVSFRVTSSCSSAGYEITTSSYADASIRFTNSAYADVSIRITNSAYADHSICLRQDQDQEKIIAAIYVLEFLDQ